MKTKDMDRYQQPPLQVHNIAPASWEQYALRKSEDENRELKARLQELTREVNDKQHRIIELEKDEIRKENELMHLRKDEEGGGLSGLGNPQTLEQLTALAGIVMPVLQGLKGGGQSQPALEGLELRHQAKATDYAKFLAQLKQEDADMLHGLLSNIAYVFNNMDREIIKSLSNQINQLIFSSDVRKQAGQ
jgi:hypothetical protein